MSDATWRDLERRWRVSPADQELLARVIQARRRAGARVPPELLDAQVFPAREVRSALPVRVRVETVMGEVQRFGPPLSKTVALGVVRLPAHRRWWFELDCADVLVPDVLSEVVRSKAPGVVMRLPRGRDEHLSELGRIGDATVFGLRDGKHVSPALLDRVCDLGWLQRLDLRGSQGMVAQGLGALARLRELVHLDLGNLSLRDLSGVPSTVARLGLQGLELQGSFETLARFEALEALDLGGTRVHSGELDAILAATKGLRVLRLPRGDRVDDACVRVISERAQRLEELELDHCPHVTGRGLQRLAALPELRRLSVRTSRTQGARLAEGIERLRKAAPGLAVRA